MAVRMPQAQMPTAIDTRYSALPDILMEEDGVGQPLLIAANRAQPATITKLPKLQMLTYAGIRSSERKYHGLGAGVCITD